MSDLINRPDSRQEDRYCDFESIMKSNFEEIARNNSSLFTTDAESLWEIYLDNMDGGTARQHYNCNGCRSFFNRYADLATIGRNGEIKSALWDIEVPEFFKKSVKALNNAILNAKITGVFVAEQIVLGIPKTGEWTHISIKVPTAKVNNSRLLTANQVMAEKREDFGMLSRALIEYSDDTAAKSLELLESDAMYRSNSVLGASRWFVELKTLISKCKNSKQATNVKWVAVASAPTGFCHIKSSMIGTLLDDIEEGMDFELVKRKFEDKMNPNNYMRSQTAPTVNHVREAEKVVEKLGIANSLLRRYATMDDIEEFIWKDKNNKVDKNNKKVAGIFGEIQTKDSKRLQVNNSFLPTTVMTWDKFLRTVLPTAQGIEAKIDNTNRLMAMVAASYEESENILQWDNGVSWYYHGGIDGEIKRRVEEAGGKYENNEIRCSLIWESYTDLDLHCYTPKNNHIYFWDRRHDNGWLDVDMNAGGGKTLTPVENIRFEKDALEGIYKFKVHNYSDRNNGFNPFKLELEVNGEIYTYNGIADRRCDEVVFEFEYIKGQKPRMIKGSRNVTSSSNNWNLSNEFAKVNAITISPNLWGNNELSHAGNHTFFLLDGCKDLSEGEGRGFFNEMLKSELKPIRRVLEAYTSSSVIEGVASATACGLGFNKDTEWNLILKVKTGSSTRLIKIDRFD